MSLAEKLEKAGNFKMAEEAKALLETIHAQEAAIAERQETINQMAVNNKELRTRITKLKNLHFKMTNILDSANAVIKVIQGEKG